MKNLAIISARSGSKGLPDKNIKLLMGKPLIAYAIEGALESNCFDTVMVSTDSNKYAAISREWGAEVPFLRSAETSGDNASSWDVVREVLREYKRLGKEFDSICLLQPTSPFRTSNDIKEAYELFMEKDAEAVTSVTDVDHSPLWCMELGEDLSLSEFRKGLKDAPRQKLAKYYRLNGAIYIRRVGVDGISLKDEKEYAYKMPIDRSVDIDTLEDFEYAEYLIGRKGEANA